MKAYIEQELTKLREEVAGYEAKIEACKHDCDIYQPLDLARGQIEAYEKVLKIICDNIDQNNSSNFSEVKNVESIFTRGNQIIIFGKYPDGPVLLRGWLLSKPLENMCGADDTLRPSQFELKNAEHIYLRGDEIVITGSPNDNDEIHNCDVAGCRLQHVLMRGWLRSKQIDATLESVNTEKGGTL